MFTGLVVCVGVLLEARVEGKNRRLVVHSELSGRLGVGESVAHQGVCLTVEVASDKQHEVVAVEETLRCSTLGALSEGAGLNLERSLRFSDRLEGHFVQGHVDAVLRCCAAEQRSGSWCFGFELPSVYAPLVIEKGSICLNGVSLTVHDVEEGRFMVSVVPHTYRATTFGQLAVGEKVNVEFDFMGKYLQRFRQLERA